MPFDFTPLIFRGFKLERTTTALSCTAILITLQCTLQTYMYILEDKRFSNQSQKYGSHLQMFTMNSSLCIHWPQKNRSKKKGENKSLKEDNFVEWKREREPCMPMQYPFNKRKFKCHARYIHEHLHHGDDHDHHLTIRSFAFLKNKEIPFKERKPLPTWSSSSGTYLTRPLQMVRGPSASPTSTSSTYKESASGCFHALRIFPTLISNRSKSEATSAAAAAAAGCCDGTTASVSREETADDDEEHDKAVEKENKTGLELIILLPAAAA